MGVPRRTGFARYVDWVAEENKGIRGPYKVAEFMEEEAQRLGYDLGVDIATGKPRTMPKGGAVSKYYRAQSHPDSWWVVAFADLFELDEDQKEALAQKYAFEFRVEAPEAPEPVAA